MLRVRQSSLDTGGAATRPAPPRPVGAKFCGWGHCGPNSVASRTDDHDAGVAGGRHLRSPVGGAAYGSPLNTTTLPGPAFVPRTGPDVVRTIESCAAAVVGRQTSSAMMRDA